MAPTSIHVWRAKDQPATRYTVELDTPRGLERFTSRLRKRQLVGTKCCGERRRAGNCIAHVYYDEIYFFCRKGKGCKQ